MNFFQKVADFKKHNPGISHQDAMAAVKNGASAKSTDLKGFLSIMDNAPKAKHVDSTSGEIELLFNDGSTVKGFYRRWDKRIVDTTFPSARVSDGYFFTIQDGKEKVIDFLTTPVVKFKELDN